MSNIQVAYRYAKAFYNHLEKQGQLEKSLEDILIIKEAVHSRPVQIFFKNQQSQQSVLYRFIDEADFAKLFSENTKLFLKFLLQKYRFFLLPQVASSFIDFHNQKNNIAVAKVLTAYPISDAYTEELKRTFEKRTGKTCTMKVLVKPSLIGGIIVELGDEVWDFSIRGKLRSFQKVIA